MHRADDTCHLGPRLKLCTLKNPYDGGYWQTRARTSKQQKGEALETGLEPVGDSKGNSTVATEDNGSMAEGSVL